MEQSSRFENSGFVYRRETNMDIIEATKSYEDWMRRCTDVVESDLRYKHQQMREDPFLFFRSAFYRLGPDLARTVPRPVSRSQSPGRWRPPCRQFRHVA